MATNDDIYGDATIGGDDEGVGGTSVLSGLAGQVMDALGDGSEPEQEGDTPRIFNDEGEDGAENPEETTVEAPEGEGAVEDKGEGAEAQPEGEEGVVPASKYEALLQRLNDALSGKATDEADPAEATETGSGEAKNAEAAQHTDEPPLRGTYRPFSEDFVGADVMEQFRKKHGDDLVDFMKDAYPVLANLLLPDAIRLTRENNAVALPNSETASRQYQADHALALFLKDNPHWRGKDAILRSGIREVAKKHGGSDVITLVEKLGEHLDETFYDAMAVAKGKKTSAVKSTPKASTTNTVSRRGTPAPKPDAANELMARTARFNQRQEFQDIY